MISPNSNTAKWLIKTSKHLSITSRMVVFITTRDNNNIITTKGTVATRPTLTISKTLVNIYD